MNDVAPCRRVLVVEDEPILRLALQDALRAEGCQVHAAENGSEGLELFRRHQHDVVLTDLVMPGLNGLELIERVIALRPDTAVFAFTAYGNVDTAVKAMKLGAVDFLTKPFRISDLIDRLRRFDPDIVHRAAARPAAGEPTERDHLGRIIGKSLRMREIYDLIETVAASDANILVQGESGTGKELVASAIHFNSPRREQPYIKVSCASLTETLLESELFGHEKGAFTGALQRKIGRFEQAHRGTIFLDEIGDLSETVQVKLLRVLQEREFERVGGTETVHVDVRLVCATLHNLDALVAGGRFREDLFYRINTVTVELPTLAERGREDIRLLAEHFRRIHSKRINKRVTSFSEEALEMLESYPWPGNVRELKNAVERAVLLCNGSRIGIEHLPEAMRRGTSASAAGRETAGAARPRRRKHAIGPLADALREAEIRHLKNVLEHTGFHRARAAELLGISRKTLWDKMRRFGILPPDRD